MRCVIYSNQGCQDPFQNPNPRFLGFLEKLKTWKLGFYIF